MGVSGESSGPRIPPRPKSLIDRMRENSRGDVDSTLKKLVANGELGDYDDELANRVHEAIELCAAVREFFAERKDEDKDCGRGDGPDVVTLELNRETGQITASGKAFQRDGSHRLVIESHQQLEVRLDRGTIAFFRRKQR